MSLLQLKECIALCKDLVQKLIPVVDTIPEMLMKIFFQLLARSFLHCVADRAKIILEVCHSFLKLVDIARHPLNIP